MLDAAPSQTRAGMFSWPGRDAPSNQWHARMYQEGTSYDCDRCCCDDAG